MAGQTTSNTYGTTTQVQNQFVDAYGYMGRLADGVTDSNTTLTNQAMISQAGARFGQAVAQWLEAFYQAQQVLGQMGEQLGVTAAQLRAADQQAADMVPQ
jgi:uncharacterized protein YukE